MSGRSVAAAAPLAAALLALAAVFLTGLDRTTPLPPEVESRFYGFFFDRYPLFAFAIVYALARVLTAALGPGRASVPRRLIGAGTGTLLVLGFSLYPTFGGLALRGGFMTGGMAFLNQVPLLGAYAIGAAVAAAILGLAMGLGVAIVGRPATGSVPVSTRPAPGKLRRLARGSGSLLLRYLTLWFALGLLGFAHAAGFGPWPQRPLDPRDAALAAGLLLAFLPHALVVSAGARVPSG